MNPALGVAIFFVIWWLVLFTTLPFGVRTAEEEGQPLVEGQARSAPQKPKLWRKMLITTAISLVLFGLFYLNYTQGWFTIEDLPGPSQLW
jgi:predicted secreted protein